MELDPGADRAAANGSAEPARVALLVGAGLYQVQYLISAFAVGRIVSVIRKQIDAINASPDGTAPPIHFDHTLNVLFAFLNLTGLGLLVVAILFMIWFHRAADVARKAGLPARREPVWAVLGFIVPIVNWWFPYQVATGLVGAQDPTRKVIGRWWTFWILTSVVVIPIYLVAAFSTAAGVVLALLAGILPWAAALAARRMITQVAHGTQPTPQLA